MGGYGVGVSPGVHFEKTEDLGYTQSLVICHGVARMKGYLGGASLPLPSTGAIGFSLITALTYLMSVDESTKRL